MKRLMVLMLVIPAMSFALTAKEIIKKVDKNQSSTTTKFTCNMTIIKGRRKLVKKFSGYGDSKTEKSFMEYVNSADKGVKYLKMKNQLWIYFPDMDDTMKISGHMLRKGMMGSDISYEDMLDDGKLEDDYNMKSLADEKLNGTLCYKIELTAKSRKASYAKQIVWVDKALFITRKVDLYAHGGRLIKQMFLEDIKKLSGRNFPSKMTFIDKRKKNSRTIVTYDKVEFDVKVPAGTFSKRNLKK